MNKIYYFTGTGNSLLAAKIIAQKLGDTELIPIASLRVEKSVKATGERIGIVFPVYDFGLPLIVREFVKKLEFDGQPYIFAVVTMGGLAAATLPYLNKMLKAKGKSLAVGFALRMPDNYTPLHGASATDDITKSIAKAESGLAKIGEILTAKAKAKIQRNNPLTNAIFTGFLYKFIDKFQEADKNFWVEDSCTSCGSCEKVCPVDNIKLENGKPTWLHHCEQCVACLQYCPAEAIQFGKTTKGRRRYQCPQIKVEEIIGQKQRV